MITHSFAVVNANKMPYSFSQFHKTYDEAKAEAERLCQKERHRFFVLKLVAYCDLKAVQWTEWL